MIVFDDGRITEVQVRAQAEVSISVVPMHPEGGTMVIGDGIVPIGVTSPEGISSFELDPPLPLDAGSTPGLLVDPGPGGETVDGYNAPDEEIGVIEPVPGPGEAAEPETHGGLQLAVRYRFTAASEALVEARETCVRLRKAVKRERKRMRQIMARADALHDWLVEQMAKPTGQAIGGEAAMRTRNRIRTMYGKAGHAWLNIRKIQRQIRRVCKRLTELEREGEPQPEDRQASTLGPSPLSGTPAGAATPPTTCERVSNRLNRARVNLNRATRRIRRAAARGRAVKPKRIASTVRASGARKRVRSRIKRSKRRIMKPLRRAQRSTRRSTRSLATVGAYVRSRCPE